MLPGNLPDAPSPPASIGRRAPMAIEGAADLKSDALHFHSEPRPGKLEIAATKPLANQRDLALAYSPGVAFPCQAIAADPAEGGNLHRAPESRRRPHQRHRRARPRRHRPARGKPVMEGKAVLFKKFAGIDVFDIEVAETERRQAGRHHRRARADLRRDQSRGHQGPRMFRGRGKGEGPHGHSRLPRRPARHRDHRLGRGHQRAGADRQVDRRR